MMNELCELFDELNTKFAEGFDKAKLKSDVLEYKDGYLVLTDLPGVGKERIELSHKDNILTISVKEKEDGGNESYMLRERNTAFQPKQIYFDGDVDFNNTSAQYENGVLRVYLPKVVKKTTNIKID